MTYNKDNTHPIENVETESTQETLVTDVTGTTINEYTSFDRLGADISNIVDCETGEVTLSDEQMFTDTLLSTYNITVEDFDFNLITREHTDFENKKLYKYTIISSDEYPKETNNLGEWVVAQSHTDKESQDKLELTGCIKTMLHIGVGNNIDKNDVKVYLPNLQSKTYYCLAETHDDKEAVDLYPIFFSMDKNKVYAVKPNLYKLNIENETMKFEEDGIPEINQDTTELKDINILKESISDTKNNITLTIQSIDSTKVDCTIENKNVFEVYIDGATWKNGENELGESLIRVKSNDTQNVVLYTTDTIKAGDSLKVSGDLQDVDASFSSIGSIEFEFKIPR